MSKGDHVYLCEVVPSCGIFELLDLVIRTVTDTYAVGVDEKTKQAHLFTYDMMDEYVFHHRIDALEALRDFRGRYEN